MKIIDYEYVNINDIEYRVAIVEGDEQPTGLPLVDVKLNGEWVGVHNVQTIFEVMDEIFN